MKKTAISLIFPFIAAMLLTSCLGNDEDGVLSSSVALLSFEVNDLKTKHTIQKENGEDSTYTTVMSGSAIKFIIDQENRKVYNVDSIAYGTDITRVKVEVSADGGVYYLNADGEAGSVTEDSIDFTNPVIFRVTSYDGLHTRDYTVSILAHQVNPAETQWSHLSTANFPAGMFVKQKAFVKEGFLYVLGQDANGICYTLQTDVADGLQWTAATEWTGIEGVSNCSSVIMSDDVFYIAVDGAIYRSADATAWTPVNNTTPVTRLLAVEEGSAMVAWGTADNAFASSENMVEWKVNEVLQSRVPGEGVAFYCSPLLTNASINRTVFIATPTEETDTCARVWTKLTTEKDWVEIAPKGNNVYGCPNLENLSVLRYANKMYAFGGKSMGPRKNPLAAFGACYESVDNGVTWKVNEKALSLPKAFEGRGENFSAATDGEYVWVMWSESGEVWRGRWNGL